ncbi:damage-inducible protein DinB [Deinococcus sp. 14RED07]|uniref:DinB family protein n=1 Tax=Deinococcus sp. 14RED07 TaxID=2745874 RepID=UPI001E601B07|nr:DinB family protein [Deinococcus sp. 14RED07]MCD0176592.1 damage-inducible protein DinB [Deinococcus sp. 14RED07]
MTHPTPDLTLLLEAFRRNARVNDALIAALTPGEFALSDGHGGWTVERHLRHMATFRVGWLWNMSRDHAMPLLNPEELDADGDPQWRWANAPATALPEALAAGDAAAVRAVEAHRASGEPFADPWNEGTYQSDPAHFLMHTTVHDSHHRGQILSLLRQGGRTPEQMDALDAHWAIWRE